jgi:hypothetical protein
MEGHRDFFRTLIRRTLRDELGLGQREAQEGAELVDYWVHRKVVEMTCKTAMTGAWVASVFGLGAMSVDYRGTYRAARYYYFSTEGIQKTIKDKLNDYFFGKLKESPIWKNEKWLWDEN